MGRLEFEPDVDNSMVAVVGTAALHALSLCAPPGQSVSQPKHPDSKQCHILEILRRSTPPAGPQVSRGVGGPGGVMDPPGGLGVALVTTRGWWGEWGNARLLCG